MTESTALRALGILRGEPLVRLMGRLREGDETLADDLHEMERAASLLALAAPPTAPPADLKRRVVSRAAAEGYYFLPERASEWEPATVRVASSGAAGTVSLTRVAIPGAYVRRLFIHARESQEARLVRLMPSAPASAIAQLTGSGFYVLSGDLHLDGERLEIGDWYGASGEPPTGRTEWGCVLFTVLAGVATRGRSRARTIVRASEGVWAEAAPGVAVKGLGEDAEHGLRASLVRMEPGAGWPAHRHEGVEQVFVVRGDWRCLGTTLRPGDYHRAGAGTEHETTTSTNGCKLIVVRHSVE